MFAGMEKLLPDWLEKHLDRLEGDFSTVESRMRLAIEYSRMNVEYGTGGPFAALVFDMADWRMLGAGVNRVVALNASMAHAEMLAIAGAQARLNSFDLGGPGMPGCELVTSCEPCAMCFGAIPWSGVRSVRCGATADDAGSIGFDEGPRHPDWIAELESRGISVSTGVCRDEAAAVLLSYGQTGGPIYNARRG